MIGDINYNEFYEKPIEEQLGIVDVELQNIYLSMKENFHNKSVEYAFLPQNERCICFECKNYLFDLVDSNSSNQLIKYDDDLTATENYFNKLENLVNDETQEFKQFLHSINEKINQICCKAIEEKMDKKEGILFCRESKYIMKSNHANEFDFGFIMCDLIHERIKRNSIKKNYVECFVECSEKSHTCKDTVTQTDAIETIDDACNPMDDDYKSKYYKTSSDLTSSSGSEHYYLAEEPNSEMQQLLKLIADKKMCSNEPSKDEPKSTSENDRLLNDIDGNSNSEELTPDPKSIDENNTDQDTSLNENSNMKLDCDCKLTDLNNTVDGNSNSKEKLTSEDMQDVDKNSNLGEQEKSMSNLIPTVCLQDANMHDTSVDEETNSKKNELSPDPKSDEGSVKLENLQDNNNQDTESIEKNPAQDDKSVQENVNLGSETDGYSKSAHSEHDSDHTISEQDGGCQCQGVKTSVDNTKPDDRSPSLVCSNEKILTNKYNFDNNSHSNVLQIEPRITESTTDCMCDVTMDRNNADPLLECSEDKMPIYPITEPTNEFGSPKPEMAGMLIIKALGNNKILVKWDLPRYENIFGYELHMNDELMHKIITPSKCLVTIEKKPFYSYSIIFKSMKEVQLNEEMAI